jgi:hypothetical protein
MDGEERDRVPPPRSGNLQPRLLPPHRKPDPETQATILSRSERLAGFHPPATLGVMGWLLHQQGMHIFVHIIINICRQIK